MLRDQPAPPPGGGVSGNFARKAVLATLGASTTLNNSNNTKLAQHLNNVRPGFERYGNVTW